MNTEVINAWQFIQSRFICTTVKKTKKNKVDQITLHQSYNRKPKTTVKYTPLFDESNTLYNNKNIEARALNPSHYVEWQEIKLCFKTRILKLLSGGLSRIKGESIPEFGASKREKHIQEAAGLWIWGTVKGLSAA